MVNIKKTIYCMLAVFILPVWMACSSATDSGNDQNLTGRVLLNGQASAPGVRVSLYSLVSLDTALVRINQEYPNIGIQISQETEFDHRLASPLFTVTSNESGEWNLGKISGGPFNIVFEKDGFGARYFYDVDVTTSRNLPDITLFPIDTLRQFLDGNKTLQSGRTYILEGDYFLLADSRLTVEDEVTVIAEQNARIIVSGTLERSGGSRFSRFTAATPQRGEWRGIEFADKENSVTNLIVEYAITAIRFNKIGPQIENIYCRSNFTGLALSNATRSDGAEFSNLLIHENDGGFDIGATDNWMIGNSIILNNINQNFSIASARGNLINNYITTSNIGISLVSVPEIVITNCEIKNNTEEDILVNQSSFVTMSNSIITPIRLGVRISRGSEILLHNNSFLGLRTALDNTNNGKMIDATENWWNTTDVSGIEARIIHKLDYDPNAQATIYNSTGIVDFDNFYFETTPNIGIQ